MGKDRSRSFFEKLTTRVFPPTHKEHRDVDLNIHQADDLFRWQMAQEQPRALNEGSFFMASVVDSKAISREVFKSLCKIGVLHPLSGELDTTRIDRNFSHGVAVVSLERQRKIIGLLFHWEEELTRWRLLEQEAVEIRKAMDIIGEDDEDCQMGLRVIERKRSMLPSVRLREGQDCALPGYTSKPKPRPPPGLPTDNLAAWPTVDVSNVDPAYTRTSLR